MNDEETTAIDRAVGAVLEPSAAPKVSKLAMGRPLLFKDGEALQSAIDSAVATLRKNKDPLIVENIAIELGCSASTLRKYRERVDIRPDFLQPIKHLLDICLAWQASQLYRPMGQVAGPIFAIKNNFPDEYKDKTEQDLAITGNVNVGTVNYADLNPGE